MRDLKPYFEGMPNELWNNVFQATQYSYRMEAARASTVWRGDWVTATAYAVGDGVYIPSTNRSYICPAGKAHTSGTFATDLAAGNWVVQFDNHNWGGRTASKMFQAISTVYGADRTKYNTVIAVQTFGSPAASANRFLSARYVSETGVAGDAAYLWATHLAEGPYMRSGLYGTATETSMVAEWLTATDERKREIEDTYVLNDDNTDVDETWDGCTTQAPLWVTAAATYGLINTHYESGPSMNIAEVGGDTGDFRYACKFSLQWKWIISKRYAFYHNLGYDPISHFTMCSSASFGAHDPDIYTPTPIWDAIVDWNNGVKTFRGG